MKTTTVDVLIIGSGSAGLQCALHLPRDLRVLLVSQGTAIECNSHYAQGGIAAVMDPTDSVAAHLDDTLRAGAGLCCPQAVEVLVREGPERIRELIGRGMPFDRKAGELALTLEAAHSHRRILHAGGDATGRELLRFLLAEVQTLGNVSRREDFFCRDLLVQDGRVVGVLGLAGPADEPEIIRSRFVVLASGGVGGAYRVTSNCAAITGDGVALAWAAGAPLADLEFVQFHPTVSQIPGAVPFLLTEALRGEGARLLNAEGERFMTAIHPLAELAPRDIVARGIFAERRRTGGPVRLDCRALGQAFLEERFPQVMELCRRAGVDPAREPVPVAPAAHYFMGGVAVDLEARTAVPGLFAIGETACTGVHGANRLASNSLLECLVFSARAARHIAARVGGQENVPGPAEPPSWMIRPCPELPALRDLFSECLGVSRSGDILKQGLERIPGLAARQSVNGKDRIGRDAYKCRNTALLAALMLTSARSREESRGGHYRTDFPDSSPVWEGRIVVQGAEVVFRPGLDVLPPQDW